jgi:predicted nucleic-acid-binding Zn-ribbon protein
LDKLKSMKPDEYLGKLTDFAVLPFTCSKCGYTVLLNKMWQNFNDNKND